MKALQCKPSAQYASVVSMHNIIVLDSLEMMMSMQVAKVNGCWQRVDKKQLNAVASCITQQLASGYCL